MYAIMTLERKYDLYLKCIEKGVRLPVIWDNLHEAKLFSSTEEAINYVVDSLFNEKINYCDDKYISHRKNTIECIERYNKIVYIHPLNIPNENEQWID